MLRDYPGKVTIKIDGLAASAASVIAMAGDTVLVSPVSMIMIHNPSTVAMGNSAEMQKAIEMLDEVKNSIINAYQVKSGLSRNKLSKLMDEETWMDAGKAVELHFADAITERNSLYGKAAEPDPDEEEKDTPPDEDLEDITTDDIRNVAHDCKNRVNKLLSTADSGKILRDGIKTVIVGKPNVGKSSLLNSLAREERAIVTDIAGTTRDVIEEYINLDGIPLMLIDTAGIRNTDDTVEKIGVEKSIKSIEKADLVVVMIDGSGFFGDEDVEVLHATKNKKRIVLINKTDLGQSKYVEAVKAKANGSVVIEVSAKTGMGLDILADEIRKVYNFGELAREDSAVITNMRHKTALIKAGEALGRVVEAIDMNMPSDIASIDINIAIDALGEITGETVSDDIVTAIFHSFCVGK